MSAAIRTESAISTERRTKKDRLQEGSLGRMVAIFLGRIVVFLLIGLAWHLLAKSGKVESILIGSPLDTAEVFIDGLFVEGTFWGPLLNTLLATLIAFGLGSIAAVAAGLFFTTFPFIRALFDPLLTGFNSMPRLALAPLFLLWFGLGMWAKISLAFSLTFFIVLYATMAGVKSVDADRLTLAKLLGASQRQVFFTLVLPSAVPTLFAGLKLGLIYALLGVVGQELVGSREGIGQQVSYFAGTFQTNGVFAVLILLAIVGTALTSLTGWLEERLLRWQ